MRCMICGGSFGPEEEKCPHCDATIGAKPEAPVEKKEVKEPVKGT